MFIQQLKLKLRSKIILIPLVASIPLIALTVAFFVTNETVPYTSELAYIEESGLEGVVGSVVPASCESNPVANHFAGDCQCSITITPACSGVPCERMVNFNTNFNYGHWGGWRAFADGVPLATVNSSSYSSYQTFPKASIRNFSIVRPDGVTVCSANIPGPTHTPARGTFLNTFPNTCSVYGWAIDDDDHYTSIDIHIYRGASAFAGGTFVGSCKADNAGAYPIGYPGNHMFNCPLPSLIGMGPQTLYIHAIDIGGFPNNVLFASGKVMDCAPPIVNISAAPANVNSGDSSTLTWSSSNATSCTASGGWSGAKSLNGTEVVSLTSPTNYSITCTNPNGNTTRSVTVTMPTATISATSCVIPIGSGWCNSNVVWSSSNFFGIASVKQSSVEFSNANSLSTIRGINPDNRTFSIEDTGGPYSVSTVTGATCAPGSAWAGSLCRPLPEVSLTSVSNVVRFGQTAEIEIVTNANYDLSCVLEGGVFDTYTHTANVVPQVTVRNTRPLDSAVEVRATCTSTLYPVLTTTETIEINVIPTIQEI